MPTTLDFTTSGTANFLIKKGAVNYLTVTNGGNIGINTTSPTYKLDVNGTARFQNSVVFASEVWHSTNDGQARFYFNSLGKTTFGSYNGYEFRNAGDLGIAFLNNNGSLGLGTLTPNINAKLDVNGNIFTNSKILIGTTDMTKVGTYSLAVNGDAIFNRVRVKLYAGWPDYVFDKNYNLMPIEQLEQFLKKEKHLPNIVTASEAEKNGIDIANTQKELLLKIEELTLYIIEQNKKIDILEKAIGIKFNR